MKIVMEYMGHTTLDMTNRYAHLSPEIGQKAVAVLDSDANGTILAPHDQTSCNDLKDMKK